MFEAHYRDLNRQNIATALTALMNAKGMSVTAARHAANIVQACREHAKTCIMQGRFLLQKYVECAPTGEPVNWPKGPFIWKTDLAEGLYNSEFREILCTRFQIRAKKLHLSQLDRAGLSPDDLQALAFVIADDMPEEDMDELEEDLAPPLSPEGQAFVDGVTRHMGEGADEVPTVKQILLAREP